MRCSVVVAMVGTLLGTAACAAGHREAVAPKRLYFALELYRDGHLIGKPRLLGETGTPLRAERRQPGATLSDYALTLKPTLEGDRYRIGVRLELPDLSGHSELALLHGEVGTLELGARPGDLAVSLTLMEVDSPEFRTLMALTDDRTGETYGSM